MNSKVSLPFPSLPTATVSFHPVHSASIPPRPVARIAAPRRPDLVFHTAGGEHIPLESPKLPYQSLSCISVQSRVESIPPASPAEDPEPRRPPARIGAFIRREERSYGANKEEVTLITAVTPILTPPPVALVITLQPAQLKNLSLENQLSENRRVGEKKHTSFFNLRSSRLFFD